MAWLDDSTAASVPAATFFQNPGPYVLPDMTKVADDWADLIDASLDLPINVTELGAIPIAGAGDVWTNVRTDGLPNGINPLLHTCSEWTSASEANSGRVLTLAIDKTLMCITPDLYVGIWHIPRMIQNRRDWYPSR